MPQDWGLAGKACNTILTEISLEDPEQIQKLLHTKASMFTSLDPTFVIELAAMDALMADGGLQLMRASIMTAMPAKANIVTMEHSAQLLMQLKDSLLFKYTGSSSRSLCMAIHEIVDGMKHGHAPKVEALNSEPFLRKIKESLPWFITKKTGDKIIYGTSALKAILEEIINAEPSSVTYESLNIFHVFSWLLTEQQAGQVSALTKIVVQSVVAQGSQLVAHSSAPRLPCKRKGTSESTPCMDEVMALFE